MSRNGSGVYTLPPGINPVTQDTTITSNWANTTLTDIAAALTQSLARDGQTVPVANLPMGGFRHTGVGNPTARNQYASLGWVQDGFHIRLTSVGGTNAISAQLVGNPTSLQPGQMVQIIPTATNTGDVTLNIGSIGPKPVVRPDGSQFAPGTFEAGHPYILIYDGSNFVVSNPPSAYSVGLEAPTGFSVSGSPVTGSGELVLSYSAGYRGYTATEATKLSGVQAGATVGADWNTNLSNIPSSFPPSAHSDHHSLRNTGGYFEIEAYNSSYGVGKARLFWDANNNRLNIGGRDSSDNNTHPEVRINSLILRSEPNYSRFYGSSGYGISIANAGTQILGEASSLIRWTAGSNNFDIRPSGAPEFNGNPIWHRGNCARVFTQSSDPGSTAQNGDLWVW